MATKRERSPSDATETLAEAPPPASGGEEHTAVSQAAPTLALGSVGSSSEANRDGSMPEAPGGPEREREGFDPYRFGRIELDEDLLSKLRAEGLPRIPTERFRRTSLASDEATPDVTTPDAQGPLGKTDANPRTATEPSAAPAPEAGQHARLEPTRPSLHRKRARQRALMLGLGGALTLGIVLLLFFAGRSAGPSPRSDAKPAIEVVSSPAIDDDSAGLAVKTVRLPASASRPTGPSPAASSLETPSPRSPTKSARAAQRPQAAPIRAAARKPERPRQPAAQSPAAPVPEQLAAPGTEPSTSPPRKRSYFETPLAPPKE